MLLLSVPDSNSVELTLLKNKVLLLLEFKGNEYGFCT